MNEGESHAERWRQLIDTGGAGVSLELAATGRMQAVGWGSGQMCLLWGAARRRGLFDCHSGGADGKMWFAVRMVGRRERRPCTWLRRSEGWGGRSVWAVFAGHVLSGLEAGTDAQCFQGMAPASNCNLFK